MWGRRDAIRIAGAAGLGFLAPERSGASRFRAGAPSCGSSPLASTPNVTPPAHIGYITKWIEAIDRVMKMDVDVLVPGHGPVGTKNELGQTRAYLELDAGRRTRLV